MGCSSSSLKYRDVYERLCHIVALSPEETRLVSSPPQSVQARSNAFAALAKDVDPITGSVRTATSAEHPYIPDPKGVSSKKLLEYGIEKWHLTATHPFSAYVCTRAVSALNAAVEAASPPPRPAGSHLRVAADYPAEEQRGSDGDAQNPDTELPRRNYRLWLLTLCETFHVLAILQEQQGFPKDAAKAFKKMEKLSGVRDDHVLDENGALMTSLCRLTITPANLKPKVIAQLRKELPGSVPSGAVDAAAVLERVRSYSVEHRVPFAPASSGAANPLQPNPSAAAELWDGRAPFLAFLECAVMDRILTLRGPEEDAMSYARPPPGDPKAADAAVSEADRGKANDVPVPGAVPGAGADGCPGSLLTPDDLRALAAALRRREQLGEMLLHLSPPPAGGLDAERAAMEAERDSIDERVRHIFDILTGGSFSLEKPEAASNTFAVFNLQETFGADGEPHHKRLSDIAFAACAPGNTPIDADEDLRSYLSTYIHLYDMFVAASAAQANGETGAGVLPMDYDTLEDTLRTLPEVEQWKVMLTADPLPSLCDGASFQALFVKLTASSGATDPRVSFDTLCELVAHAIAHDGCLGMRDLSGLKHLLGVDRPGSEGRAVSAAFLAASCAAMSVVEPANEGAKEDAFFAAVAQGSHLGVYAPSPLAGAGVATRFCAGATTLRAVTAEAAPHSSMAAEWIRHVTHLANTRDGDEGSSFPLLSSLHAHSLYVTAVVLRCAWASQSADGTAALRGAVAPEEGGKGRLSMIAPETQVGHRWFGEITRGVAAVLGCSTQRLLDNAGVILAVRPPGVAGGRVVGHNKAAPEERAGGELDETALVDRAFHELAALDHEAGMHGSTVILEDLMYVCLFNGIRQLFEGEPDLNAFFIAPFPFNAAAVINNLLEALPLTDEARQYKDFFLFNQGARVVAFGADDTATGGPDPDSAADHFIHAMYDHYREVMAPIMETEEGFAQWFRKGVAHIKATSDDPHRLELSPHDYAALLEYLVGHFIVYAKHKGTKAMGSPDAVASAMGGDAVRRRLVEELLLFPEDETSIDAATREAAAEAAKRIFTELQLAEMEARNGDVSLTSAAAWYSKHRVAQMGQRQSSLAQWREAASLLPDTSSWAHRRARHDMACGLREEKRAKGSVQDGYIAASALVERCVDLLGRERIPLMPSAPDAETWLRDCIRRTNELVGRSDLGREELHEQDLRPFFAFAHSDMSAFCAMEEAKREMDAVRSLQQEGKLPFEDHAESTAAALQGALDRCLLTELNAPAACMTELRNDGSLARHGGDATNARDLDTEGLAHHIATTLTSYAQGLFNQAQREHREVLEAKVLESFEEAKLRGCYPQDRNHHVKDAQMNEGVATYWERLRYLLPHGDSARQRALRQRLWHLIDSREKGYVTLADLNRGVHNVLGLREFRDDLAPVLFRAFFATTEMYSASSEVIYLTADNEQYITPRQFRVFLTYLYEYMELYFMFDVLTCSGLLDEDLHVVESALDPALMAHTGFAAAAAASAGGTADGARMRTAARGSPNPTAADPADALLRSSASPYRIMYESTGVSKRVTRAQFAMAGRLLRHWGVHVDDAEAAFLDINRRAKEQGEMHFTGFAIWASEKGLHPEGYGHGFTEQADEVAKIEARLSAS